MTGLPHLSIRVRLYLHLHHEGLCASSRLALRSCELVVERSRAFWRAPLLIVQSQAFSCIRACRCRLRCSCPSSKELPAIHTVFITAITDGCAVRFTLSPPATPNVQGNELNCPRTRRFEYRCIFQCRADYILSRFRPSALSDRLVV